MKTCKKFITFEKQVSKQVETLFLKKILLNVIFFHKRVSIYYLSGWHRPRAPNTVDPTKKKS